MNRAFLPILLTLLVAACASPRQAQTPEEQAYLTAATAQPTTFSLASSESQAAWERALQWIEEHATMGIKTKSDDVLETFDPPTSSTTTPRNEYGYRITRKTTGTSYTFTVSCVGNDPSINPQAEQNAHLLAYYIMTGKPTPKNLVE